MTSAEKNRGYLFALTAAALFGASTPASKYLLTSLTPWLLAGLLYFGSGIGLAILSFTRSFKKNVSLKEAPLNKKDWKWLGSATFFGGILGPIFLMIGLSKTNAASASLFLNMEGIFTALIAWIIFKEHFDRRIALGMALILGGGVVLSWTGTPTLANLLGPLLIAAACLCWGIDNNLTRKISASDPLQIAMFKSLLAGSTNIAISLTAGSILPNLQITLLASIVGFFGYGMSLLCFILALRNIGTARTGAYFSTAPFVGAALSLIFLGGSMTLQFLIAGFLMGLGVWLHLTENHSHEHEHEPLEHEHQHSHDEHHQHKHGANAPLGEPHTHWHRHEKIKHTHPHYPDIHHRHEHSSS
jgi:drug/metabolite transporter (DMT)-like permease